MSCGLGIARIVYEASPKFLASLVRACVYFVAQSIRNVGWQHGR